MAPGDLFAMMDGTTMMLVWLAGSLVSNLHVVTYSAVILDADSSIGVKHAVIHIMQI